MKYHFLSLTALSLTLLFSGCASVGIGYSAETVTVYGNDRGSQRFIKAGNLIGCGTVVSLRKVNQTPFYDQQYEMQFNGSGSTSEVAGLAVQTGLLGMAAAVMASAATDATIEATCTAKKEIKMVNIPKDQGLVKAVKLRLDDGREINLPMLDANKFDFSGHYKVGNRYQIFYSPTYDNLQLFASREKEKYDTHEEAEKAKKWFCRTDFDKTKADELIANNANKVDESKIY